MLQRKASEEFVPLEQLCSLSNAATACNESSIQHHSQQHYQQQLQQQHHQLQQLPNEQHEQSTCSREHQHPVNQTYELALYGWRKKCLYIFMGFVTLAILINALLTLWIIDILCFSMNGIGKLKFGEKSLTLEQGDAFLYEEVYAKLISSRKDHSIKFHSKHNIALNTRISDSEILNQLFVNKTLVSALANQFVVRSPDGKLMFLVSETDAVVATDKLRVNNAAGIKFNGSIQVPLVQSNPHRELNILSPTRKVRIRGPQSVSSESQSGEISSTCVGNLNLRTKEKSILLDSSKIEFSNLKTTHPTKRGRTYPGIHQLCMCANSGKLFIAAPEGACLTDANVCKKDVASNIDENSLG